MRFIRSAGLGAILALGVLAAPAQERGTLGPATHRAAPHTGSSTMKSLAGKLDLVAFDHAPFPYDDRVPETGEPGTPFLDHDENGAFHLSPRGGKLYETSTYRDQRSLLYVPSRFDLSRRNPAIVLFLHGNLATLKRDVIDRQHVPQQLEASGLNAVLVAPQMAVNALDSSAGRFWKPGFLEEYLGEAADRLAALSGNRIPAASLRRLPVIVVAYSGGYLATAFTLRYALNDGVSRIEGVVLLDALFGEEAKFAHWIEDKRQTTFFVSAYSMASRGLNAQLIATLAGEPNVRIGKLPETIATGDVVFVAAPGAVHNDFVTKAWVSNPLQDVLKRIDLDAPRRPVRQVTPGAPPAGAD